MTVKKTKIGRSVYLIENDSERRIIKYAPPASQSYSQKVSRYIFGGSLPFQNEILANTLLKRYSFKYLKYPDSTISDDRKSIEFEYIDGIEQRLQSRAEKEIVLKSLAELANLSKYYQTKGLSSVVLSVMESPFLTLLRIILFSKHPLPDKTKAMTLIIQFLLKKRVGVPVLLHNDLQCKNILKADNGEIYLLDFEDITIGSRLQLSDAVNVVFNSDTLKIDRSLLLEYWQSIDGNIYDKNRVDPEIKNQVRICLLRQAIAPCTNMPHSQKFDDLRLIVLDDHKYDQWWNEQ